MLFFWSALVIVYFFISLKVQEWQTILRLGFASETPALYIQNPKLYHNTNIGFFGIILLIPVLSPDVMILSIIVPIFIAIFVAARSRITGIKKYRFILKEMINEEAEGTQLKTDLQKQLNKTDEQLFQEMKKQDPACARVTVEKRKGQYEI